MKTSLALQCILFFSVLLLTTCHKAELAGKGDSQKTACECGPDFCFNDPRYPPKLAKKKADLKAAGFPDDLIALLDRDGKCFAAVERGPDTFTILLVQANGDNRTISWTQQDEDLAKKEILNGTIKEYYKFNVRKALACCKEPRAEDRPDWDPALSLSRNLSIACTKQGSSVGCK